MELHISLKLPDGRISPYVLTGPKNVIGRDLTSAIPINDTNVSGQHSSIVFKKGQFWCQDGDGEKNSRNGTWVNDHRISEPVLLKKGDTILIGKCLLTVANITDINVGETEEISMLRGRDNLTPDDYHQLQLTRLDEQISKQGRKISLALVALVFLLIGVGLFLWYASPTPVTAEKVSKKWFKTGYFHTVAKAKRNFTLDAPTSGTVEEVYGKNNKFIEPGANVVKISGNTIRSPLGGYIESIVNKNSSISKGSKICKIVDYSTILFHLSLDPKEFPDWKEQQQISIHLVKLDKKFKGLVTNVLSRDGNIASVEVFIEIDNHKEQIRPGMKAKIKYAKKTKKPYFVMSSDCIIKKDSDFLVCAIKDGRCKLTKIFIKEMIGNSKHIVEGDIEDNSLVIISPPEKIKDGQFVAVTKVR